MCIENHKNVFYYSSPIGRLGVCEDNGEITHVLFENEKCPEGYIEKETEILKKAGEALSQYFQGNKKTFTLPLNPHGTEFMKKVWRSLEKIPYGETRSYKEIAEDIENPKGCRAVGNANNKNPIHIFIPCHRVVGANGKLVGYAGGIEVKKFLLELETRNK